MIKSNIDKINNNLKNETVTTLVPDRLRNAIFDKIKDTNIDKGSLTDIKKSVNDVMKSFAADQNANISSSTDTNNLIKNVPDKLRNAIFDKIKDANIDKGSLTDIKKGITDAMKTFAVDQNANMGSSIKPNITMSNESTSATQAIPKPTTQAMAQQRKTFITAPKATALQKNQQQKSSVSQTTTQRTISPVTPKSIPSQQTAQKKENTEDSYLVRLGNNIAEKIKYIITKLSEIYEQHIKNNKSFTIEDFLNFTPKQDFINEKGEIESREIEKLEKYSYTYFLLYSMLIFSMEIIPIIICILTFTYLFLCIKSTIFMFKKKMFLGDERKYVDVGNMIHVFNKIYIPDYIFILCVLCIIYIIFTTYLQYSKFIDFTNPKIVDKYNNVNTFIRLCIMMIIINFIVYYHPYQMMGYKKDNFDQRVYENINYDYLEYLENVQKNEKKCNNDCNINLVEVNTLQNLKNYIIDMQMQVISKNGIDDLAILSTEQIKKYTVTFADSKEEKSFYNQIRNAIMTYYLISNFSQTKYDILLTPSFFYNKVSILSAVNANKSSIFSFKNSIESCLNIDIDGKNNQSQYMKDICEDCATIKNNIHKELGTVIDLLSNYQFSLQFFLIVLVSLVCIIYIIYSMKSK